MAGPHRLVALTRTALTTAFAQLPRESTVLLAVSGGADSMALAAAAAYARRERHILVHALVVDHGIRPESGAEARQVCHRLVTLLNIPTTTVRISLGSGHGPEGDAREARYEALFARSLELSECARELPEHAAEQPMNDPELPERSVVHVPIFLGHNASDQAETMLLGLGRGSGTRSLAGMSPASTMLWSGQSFELRRPLLEFTASQLRTVCSELDLPYVEDPTNELTGAWRTAEGDPLRRVSLRHRVLPLLEEILDGGVEQAFGRSAKILREDDEALTLFAQHAFEQCAMSSSTQTLALNCTALARYPRAVRVRVLRKAVSACGGRVGELVYWHLDALDKLVVGYEKTSEIDLPGLTARRRHSFLEFRPQPV